jgi:hypothetical protein
MIIDDCCGAAALHVPLEDALGVGLVVKKFEGQLGVTLFASPPEDETVKAKVTSTLDLEATRSVVFILNEYDET